ncbi:MAG: hypothetical protein IM539_19570 [Pseudanabaena sp. M046S1SP1A06QC]|nr:hypothetical protein [Pseudanabaena sp. M046S1SP1A06QC]
MKKLILMSALIGATTASMLSASTLSAQTVMIPIIGGNLGLKVNNLGLPAPIEMSASTLLTTLGTVSINQFNGTAENTTFQAYGVLPVNANIITGFFDFTPTENFRFIGTTNGSVAFSPPFNFKNAPTVINANNISAPPGTSIINAPITSGSITFASGSITFALVNDSTLASSNISKPEFQQEYRNDFNSSSFVGGRVLGLEDK